MKALQSLRLRREATDEDLLAGSIGTNFRLRLRDGTARAVRTNGPLVGLEGKLYVASGRSPDSHAFWDSLPYDEVPAPEEEFP